MWLCPTGQLQPTPEVVKRDIPGKGAGHFPQGERFFALSFRNGKIWPYIRSQKPIIRLRRNCTHFSSKKLPAANRPLYMPRQSLKGPKGYWAGFFYREKLVISSDFYHGPA